MYRINRYVPAINLSSLHNEMDRLFEGFLGAGNGVGSPVGLPALNVWEDADKVYVEADVPGLTMDHIELLVLGHELSIKGRREFKTPEKVVFHRRERGEGEFSRYITLPTEVDSDRVEAVLKDGVLSLTMPKAERARAKRIAVKQA